MKFWDQHSSWENAEKAWDEGLTGAVNPIKKLKVLPHIPGLTKETAKRLRWKSLVYMVFYDKGLVISRHFLKRPFLYAFRYVRSILKGPSFKRKGDFFLYGLSSIEEFVKSCKKTDSIVVAGFSYCQKPHECPSGRFNDHCIRNPEHPVCRQCDIGKILHALPEKNTVPLIIPTIHYIGDQIFKLSHQNPKKKILFLITACELTLKMFGDYGNMAGIKGIGVRLDGRICNTMKAFELSEKGIKPGLTILMTETRKQILDLIRALREDACV